MSGEADSRRRRRRLILVIVSVLGTLGVTWTALASYERWLGAHLPNMYVVEPRPVLWEADDELGYRNKANLLHLAFALEARTDDQGFRGAGQRPATLPEGAVRLAGLGDSIAWGMRVAADKTYISKLGAQLSKTGRPVDVINAGVVGYGLLQTSLLYEQRVRRFQPDIVVVSVCANDLMATENPFGKVRSVYHRYFASHASKPDAQTVDRFVTTEGQHVWTALERLVGAEAKGGEATDRLRGIVRLLILDPLREIARAVEADGGRFVALILPYAQPDDVDVAIRSAITHQLDEWGVPYLDVSKELLDAEARLQPTVSSHGERPSFPLLRTIDNIKRAHRLEAIQRERIFLDNLHPTELGHATIADALSRYLSR